MSLFKGKQTRQNYARADFRVRYPRLYRFLVWLGRIEPVLEIDYSRRTYRRPTLVVDNIKAKTPAHEIHKPGNFYNIDD